MDSERLDLRPVRPLDQATHLRLGHQLTLRRPEVKGEKQRPKAKISPNATSPESGQDSTGADSHASRTHSARRIPAPSARSSSKANSASLTLVPTDFARAAAS